MDADTFLVIREDETHFNIYDSIDKRIVLTLGAEADALQLIQWMQSKDVYSIDNSFFLDGQMKEKIHAALERK